MLVIIGSLAGGEDEPSATTLVGAADTTTSEATATTEPDADTTTFQATTSVPETTTTTQSTTTTTQGQTEQPPAVEFSGSGNEVIEFGDDLAWLTDTFGIFQFQVSGSGNNAVWALDENFETSDLLVNTIGDQTGTRFISLTSNATGLEVEVSGGWTFTIHPATNMLPPRSVADFNVPVIDTTGSFEGADGAAVNRVGPEVVFLRTEGRVAEITAAGDGNIAMWIYSSTGTADLLVNEIEQFEGSVRLPDCSDSCWIDVDGVMTYSLSIRS